MTLTCLTTLSGAHGMLTRVPVALNPVTRRRVLMGAAVAPLVVVATGCTEEPADVVAVDPDRQALEAAYLVEDGLRASLARWAAPFDDLEAAADAVVASHLAALNAALGDELATTIPTPDSSAAETTADMIRAVDAAADAHSRSLGTASATISPLVASIAASDAALAAALRAGSR